jgi:hypothetical protein
VAEPDASKADVQDDGSSRRLRRLGGLFALILIPAGIYAAYVLGQIEYIRRHDLRSLENTARAASTLLETTLTNVGNLIEDPVDPCTTFRRLPLATLVTPDCRSLQSLAATQKPDKKALRVETTDGRVEIVGPLPAGAAFDKVRVEIPLAKFLEQIPFGDAFDQMFVVDNAGALIGYAISPQRGSPMLPPRGTIKSSAVPLRVLDIGKLKFAGSTKDLPLTIKELGDATLVQKVELGGTSYTLMCQPWRVNGAAAATWRFCGLVDGQRSFKQALEVAPQVVMVLLVLLTLALVSWPILKILSLAPRERIGFADLYLMLLASMTLVMIFAVAAVDIGTYAQLREKSRQRLATLATQIEGNLHAEITQMYQQLRTYDAEVAQDEGLRTALSQELSPLISCMLLPPAQRQSDRTCRSGRYSLTVPKLYEPLDSVFWMRPCDGMQIIKGSARRLNTPAVPLAGRDYFQAIKQDRLWPSGYVVDTSASLTTGEFFAAVAIPSRLSDSGLQPSKPSSDCLPPENARFGAVLSGQPVSVRYPILAPGVGFAIADQNGRVMFHSDERRAVVAENLLADDGLADRVRAALVTRGQADFDAQYQTRPYQLHIQPMKGTPWSVMTFADDEILRTLHIELLAQTGILVTIYLLLAFFGTLVYILFHGRTPPVWIWPRRQPLYRPLYCGTVWTLGAQLILFLLALDVLRGEMLVIASMLLPLPALLTVVLAARAALRLKDERAEAVESRQQRINALLIAAAAVVLIVAFFAMDPVSAGQRRMGTQTAILGVLLVATAVAATVRKFTAISDPVWMRWWREPLGPHIIGTILFWMLLGALPAYGLYKFALGMQMTLVAKTEQAYLGRAFAWRDCQIQSDFRQIPTAAHGATVQGRIDADADIYRSALLSRSVMVAPAAQVGANAADRALSLPFWDYLENIAPVYNDTTTYSRYLGPFVIAGDPRWRWILQPRQEPQLVYSPRRVCSAVQRSIASRLPVREPQFGAVGIVLALGSLALLFAWVSFGTRKLFFGDIDDEKAPTGRGPMGSLLQRPDELWATAEAEPIKACFDDDPVQEWSDPGKYATRRAVVDQILEKLRPYYLSKWQSCSAEERLLLIQLVEEGYANPKQDEVVRKLVKAGLLRIDPVLRPMNQSFALFVSANTEPEQVRKLEQAQRGLRWSLVRTLLVAALLVIMVFLALTQRDVVEVWVAYLGTAGAGTIGVLKLLSLLAKPNAPKSD